MTRTDHTHPAAQHHTPGPWIIDEIYVDSPENMAQCLLESKGTDREWVAVGIADAGGYAESVAYCHPSNAPRIVAAVNACEGISTEALEHGVVRELREALTLCWQQLSLWVSDIETCDLSPEDDEALAKASAVLAKAPWRE